MADRNFEIDVELVVVGAHLTGMPLNRDLVDIGGRLVVGTQTAPCYRLYELADASPRKPGLLRVANGGAAIEVEVWRLGLAAFGAFVVAIPAPLGIGTVYLADGRSAKGFLVESVAIAGARDVTEFGGWRKFLAQGTAA